MFQYFYNIQIENMCKMNKTIEFEVCTHKYCSEIRIRTNYYLNFQKTKY